MRAVIILEWKEKGKVDTTFVGREAFLQYLDIIIKDPITLAELKGLAKDVDSIYVNADEDAMNQEKNIIFKYEENMDFNEETKKVDVSKQENLYYFIKSYCQEVIVFKVVENKEERTRAKSKEQVLAMMKAIKVGYPDNNEISSKLCEILPRTYFILINKDRINSYPENPMIICYTLNETIDRAITIKNNHKIIWAHLNEWCK